MERCILYFRVFISRMAVFFSTQKNLHTARLAFLHELFKISIPKELISRKMSVLLLAIGQFNQVFCAKPTAIQPELGNMFIIAKTRAGKGLNIGANLLRWPYPAVANDIKREHWYLTAGFREKGLDGKSFLFDPKGNGHRFDPLEGKVTEFDLQSAATTLLYRANEGQNQIFTDSAITMLTQIFLAARLEKQRPLPFAQKIMYEGFLGVATILEIISQKHKVYPNLATRFLDVDFANADFQNKFLRDCWGTLTRRMNRILTKESVRCFTGSDFTAKDIITSGEHPISVFLCWPEKDLLSLSPLIQLIWSSLIDGMIDTYDSSKGEGCFPVLLVLDEIFRTGMPKLPEYTTTVCGRNISILATAQSKSQLDSEFGKYKADTLLGQMDSAIFHRPAKLDNTTASFIEETLGYKSGFAHSKNEHGGSTSNGESETKIALMPAHEIKNIGNDEVIGFRSDLWPFRAKRLDWRDFPELKRRANIAPPPIPVLPSADASLQSRYKPAPSAKLNIMPLQFPQVIFPPLGA
jgi:type IV secretion system protein VirD4